jgi:hypothetical protein
MPVTGCSKLDAKDHSEHYNCFTKKFSWRTTSLKEDFMTVDIAEIKTVLKDLSQRFQTLGGYL